MTDRAAIAAGYYGGGGFGGIGLIVLCVGAAVRRWQVLVSSAAATPGRNALLSEP